MQVRGFWDYALTQQGADTLVTFSPHVKLLLQGVDATTITAANFDMPPRPDAHTFVGTDGVESLYGWAPGDVCYGLDGGDYFGDHDGAWSTFYGGKGSDSFEIDNAADTVVELAGEGHDLIWLYLDGDYVMPDEVEDIYLNQHITRTGALTANGLSNLVQGSLSADTVFGGGGDDTVRGLFGDDSIDGGEGDDMIDGGGGASTLTGGTGADSFFVEWEAGNHVITDFTIGEDQITVWSFTTTQSLTQVGDDVLAVFWPGGDPEFPRTSMLIKNVSLDALTSDSIVYHQLGTAAPDTMLGGEGDDDMDGGGGQDTIGGLDGDDDIDGDSGDDGIDGGEDDDTISGGGGEDTIQGGDGEDTMSGGNGGDVFVFTSITESDPELMDRIKGFNPDEDTIDLSAIDANGDAADGDQAFFFADNVQFNHVAGEAVLEYDIDHDRTFLMLDVDGDAVADFTLMLKGEVSEWHDCWVL